MLVSNINSKISTTPFKNNNTQEQPLQKQKDPLVDGPARYIAFSNEVGTALSPLSPTLALASWVPALLYIGADVYDKYKAGENKDYKEPSLKKGVCEAVFQGLASCGFTIFAVEAGKEIASEAGKFFSDSKLSLNSQNELLDFMGKKVADGALQKEGGVQKNIIDPVKNMMKQAKTADKSKLKDITNLNGSKLKHTSKMDLANVEKFMYAKLQDTSCMKSALENNQLPAEATEKISKNFSKMSELLKKNQTAFQYDDNPKLTALNSTLGKFLKDKTLKRNLLIAGAGLIALAFAIKPLDKLTEKYIVEPLDHFWTKKENEKKSSTKV